jgi:hypothetical protein
MTTFEQQSFSQDTTKILTQGQVKAHTFTCLFYLLSMGKKEQLKKQQLKTIIIRHKA